VIVNDAHVRHLPASWGTHPVIGNDAHGQHLPASWGTLYELTKLDKRPGEEGSTSSAVLASVQFRCQDSQMLKSGSA
jgi:hypothetical protein